MYALESAAAVITRKMAERSPEWWTPSKRLFPWEYVTFAEAQVDWEDRSYHKNLTCVNHPRARWSTKNPWDRSIFMHKGMNGGDAMYDEECKCPFSDLRVIGGE